MTTPAPEATVGELSMLVRQLISALKRYDVGHPVAAQATRLLVDRGLMRLDGLRARAAEYVQLDGETLARSADLVVARLAAADMVPLDSQDGISMGRKGEWTGPEGGPVIAIDAGPGRGFVGPRWQFEPALQAALGPIADALGTKEGWALLAFLESPHGALLGRAPRQAIEQGQVDLVIRLARSEDQ